MSEPTPSKSVPDRAAPTLWREAVGRELRARRRGKAQTLAETAKRAGVSPQYLSEMERGAKDASSEMVAAVAGALGLDLLDLTEAVSAGLRSAAGADRVSSRAQVALAA